MNQFFFLQLQRLILIVRGLLHPFSVFILPMISLSLRKRLEFEGKNLSDHHSKSFKLDGLRAQIAFEVSSDGELEQIRPLLDFLLLKNELYIELIYSSESVERRCSSLAAKFPQKLRLFRLPLLSYFFVNWGRGQSLRQWMTAPKLILCRYDFFPELLLSGMRPGHALILVNATLKNRQEAIRRYGTLPYEYLKNLYRLFEFILAAGEDDRQRLLELGIPAERIFPFDLRLVQILKRISSSEETLSQYPFYAPFKDYLGQFQKNHRLILGSAWPAEMELFEHREFLTRVKNGQIHVAIAPHKLDQNALTEIQTGLALVVAKTGVEIPIYLLGNTTFGHGMTPQAYFSGIKSRPGILIITLPGILCELYTLYGHSFVGGGHGRSIHSVLEPYLASGRVYCGPKVHRSTEFDFAQKNSPQYIHIVKQLKEFYPLLGVHLNGHEMHRPMRFFGQKVETDFSQVVQRLLNA